MVVAHERQRFPRIDVARRCLREACRAVRVVGCCALAVEMLPQLLNIVRGIQARVTCLRCVLRTGAMARGGCRSPPGSTHRIRRGRVKPRWDLYTHVGIVTQGSVAGRPSPGLWSSIPLVFRLGRRPPGDPLGRGY